MADDFEARLEALFAEAPPAPDADAFVRRALAAIDADARRRRLVIGGFSVVGAMVSLGVIAASGAPTKAITVFSQTDLSVLVASAPWIALALAASVVAMISLRGEPI